MKVIEVIESKQWRHADGRTASLYGAVPYTSEADKSNWSVVTVGYTWLNDNGTVGLGRVPAKTREEAMEVMERINNRYNGVNK